MAHEISRCASAEEEDSSASVHWFLTQEASNGAAVPSFRSHRFSSLSVRPNQSFSLPSEVLQVSLKHFAVLFKQMQFWTYAG